MSKFSKSEIKKYTWTIDYIRQELATDRHIIACLGSAGLTFNSDIERFTKFASQFGALDITEEILKYCNFIKI